MHGQNRIQKGECVFETKISVAKPEGKRQIRILWCRGMIILKCTCKQYGVMTSHGLIWLKVKTGSAGFRDQQNGRRICLHEQSTNFSPGIFTVE